MNSTMPTFKGQFASIVLIGRHNPQILNHDFLVRHDVLPRESEPFRSLLADSGRGPGSGVSPFSEFISTPVASSIRYGPIAVTVDESRFQIVDHGYFDHPSSTTIVDIIKRYFGKLLIHTPLQIGGVNFNGLVVFRNLEDEWEFDRRIGISRPVVQSWAKSPDNLRISSKVSFTREHYAVEFQVAKPKGFTDNGLVNTNYEHTFHSLDDMMKWVGSIEELYRDFVGVLQSLDVEVMA
jgi:hypothetical protein